MKTKILIIALVFVSIFNSFSQSQIIKDFRKIIADAPSQFSNLQADLIQVNGGNKFYHTTIENSSIANAYIQKSDATLPMYIIDYNTKKMDSNMSRLFSVIVSQYLDELSKW